MYTSIVACISMEVTFFFSASCWSFTLKKKKKEKKKGKNKKWDVHYNDPYGTIGP